MLLRNKGLIAVSSLIFSVLVFHSDSEAQTKTQGSDGSLLHSALTTKVVVKTEKVAEGSSDMAWLQGLRMPDFPIKLETPVVEQLERIRGKGPWHRRTGRWLQLSGRYEPMIRRILREEGLPEDLLYVSMIESSFNPFAKSRAGAAGLWQFMPGAGGEQNLIQDRWVDERYDPEKSTRAAAKTFKRLYKRLGSWELAFAAYNMGYYGLTSTIRNYNSNDYWTLWRYEYALPYETRNYVPRILAAAIAGRNPERFGFEDLEKNPAIRTETIKLRRPVGISKMARALGISTDDLRNLNPELKRNRTPAGRDHYSLRIPLGSSEKVTGRMKSLVINEPDLKQHKVRVGEDIAAIAKQYGISKNRLARLNKVGQRSAIKPGSILVVPAKAQPVKGAEAEPDDVVTTVIPAQRFSYKNRRRLFYRVVRGDTLGRVASAFNVVPAEIALWNQIDLNAVLQPGMILQLFVSTRFRSDVRFLKESQVRIFVAGSTELFEDIAQRRDNIRIVYRARSGDTLKRISKRFDIGIGLICRINHFSRNHEPERGEEMILYVESKRVPRNRSRKSSKTTKASLASKVKSSTKSVEKNTKTKVEESQPSKSQPNDQGS